MRIKWLAFLIVLAVCANSVPSLISFQGVLKDSSGSPINGSREITFTIFGAATGPGHSWTETQTVSIEAGLYNVQLGAVTPLPTSAFDGTTKYLGITIGGTELLPRVMMVSVPYAYRADQATYADTAGSSGGFPNSVLLNPTTAQTTSAANAIYIKSAASGNDSVNTINIVSIESTGNHAFAAQFGHGTTLGKIGGRLDNSIYAGALFQTGSSAFSYQAFRQGLGPYFINYGGVLAANGSEAEIANGLLVEVDGGNAYGYAAQFIGGVGIVLPDSTGAVGALLASIDSGTKEGTVRYDGNDNHFYGWNGTAWKQLDNN
jgi:hypothetical protein